VYRLVRKIRARVKAQEFALLSATVAFALLFGCGAGYWYKEAGRGIPLIASVNIAGGVYGAAVETENEPGSGEGRGSYDLFAVREDAGTSGFFTSPRARLLQPANGVTASYMGLNSEARAQGDDDRTDNMSDNTSIEPGADDTVRGQNTGDATGARADGQAAGDTEGMPDDMAMGHADADEDAGQQEDPLADLTQYTVKVIYYGERHVIQTTGKKVSELFDEYNFTLSEHDKMTGAYLDGIINSDLYIEINSVTKKSIVEEVKIPAKTVYRDNAELSGGQTKVIRNAADGLKRMEYALTYENGVQVSKVLIKETVVKEAVSGIVEQGSAGARKGKGGIDFSYSKVIDVKCTAYTASYEDTGKRPGDPGFGITKSGMVAKEGVVAVDPTVIPLGTKMYIEILDDSIEDYGFAIAGDTGGKIKGKKVDLYFDATREQLLQFGVRKAKVYILD